MTNQIINHYHVNAAYYQAQYDSVLPADVHAAWVSLLDDREPGNALDIGAGSGRDALWLAQRGWQVTAVEPAAALRELGAQKTSAAVHWVDAQLPELVDVPAPDAGFDLILLSAVWMHLPEKERKSAFDRLCHFLSDEGIMIVTLRFGPSDPKRPMYPVSVGELSELALPYGFIVDVMTQQPGNDCLQRAEITWQTVKIAKEIGRRL